MIVDQALTVDLAVGTDRRIPQGDDAQTIIPPIIIPVALTLVPTQQNPATTTLQNTSFITSVFTTRNNAAAAAFNVCNLDNGLWELEYLLQTWFDYTGSAGSADEIQVSINDINTALTPVATQFAQTGAWTVYNRNRYLFTQSKQIQLNVPLTGVAENLNARVIVNAIRII